jgi:putative hydrolase of HD superfamily
MHLLEMLKLNKRLGWIQCGISEEKAESIADHMYRMAIMAILFNGDSSIDINKYPRSNQQISVYFFPGASKWL